MNAKRIVNIVCLSSLIVFGTGCKKYLDVNQNQNVAQDVPEELLLSSAQIYTASALGVDLNINGSIWSQYWTQSPAASQYKIYDQYQPSANNYDRVWTLLYSSSLTDLDRMEKKATASNKKEYVAIAKIMKAYNYQMITDGWGNIPFSEALQGLIAEGNILSPKYDQQEAVYDGIFTLLTDARTLIEGLVTSNVSGDLIFNGDMHMWYKFANTLQLRAYLRIAEVNAGKAAAGIDALYAATGGDFLEEGEVAQISFLSAAGNQNPLYSEIQGLNATQNIVGSATVIDSFRSNSDLRLDLFFAGNLVGIPQGAYNLPASTPVAKPSGITGADATDDNSALAPVIFMSDYESLFLRAEAAARGWGAEVGSDQELFERGIYANFARYSANVDEFGVILRDAFAVDTVPVPPAIFPLTAEYAAYTYINGDTLTGFLEEEPVVNTPASYWGQYPAGGSTEDKLRHISTQKWFSMTGTQGFESWTEWRRTGYPDFFTVSLNSLIGSSFPARFLYPNVELTRNANFPGQITVPNKVWWDVKD